MQGVCPGRGSAGRSAVANNGSDVRALPVGEGRFLGFGDVGKACEQWLMQHDPEWRKMKERYAYQQAQKEVHEGGEG